jgi:hypothetical protein
MKTGDILQLSAETRNLLREAGGSPDEPTSARYKEPSLLADAGERARFRQHVASFRRELEMLLAEHGRQSERKEPR